MSERADYEGESPHPVDEYTDELKSALYKLRKVRHAHEWDDQTADQLDDAITAAVVARGRIGLHYKVRDRRYVEEVDS